MIIYSRVTEPPDSEPITLAEAKAHLKIDEDQTSEDGLLAIWIKLSRRLCESYTSRSFITQVRKMTLDKFPIWSHQKDVYFSNWRRHDGIIVPHGPVQSIDSIKYIIDGVQTTLDPSLYIEDLQSDVARLFPVDSWPAIDDVPNAVEIIYTAGYDPVSGGTEEMPEEIKGAILLQIGSFYQNRQDETPDKVNRLNWNSEKILDSIKVYWNANQD